MVSWLLMRLRDGLCTEADVIKIQENCSPHTLTAKQWNDRGFNCDDVIHIYTTNAEVDAYNKKRLIELDVPIALVEAGTTGHSNLCENCFRGLEKQLFLAVVAKVFVTQNLCSKAGLVNGSNGIVKDIVYEEGATAPKLPKFVWVDFGEIYKGSSFFPNDKDGARKGWVPIAPMTAKYFTYSSQKQDWLEHTRTMLPLRLCYAWTVWKAQGQTFKKRLWSLSLTKRRNMGSVTLLSRE
jgi:ATP-dependent exoDNAse (exonuclease V) alpha subunit